MKKPTKMHIRMDADDLPSTVLCGKKYNASKTQTLGPKWFVDIITRASREPMYCKTCFRIALNELPIES
jgi:hypothetical protein